jgi:hypothetical protein
MYPSARFKNVGQTKYNVMFLQCSSNEVRALLCLSAEPTATKPWSATLVSPTHNFNEVKVELCWSAELKVTSLRHRLV